MSLLIVDSSFARRFDKIIGNFFHVEFRGTISIPAVSLLYLSLFILFVINSTFLAFGTLKVDLINCRNNFVVKNKSTFLQRFHLSSNPRQEQVFSHTRFFRTDKMDRDILYRSISQADKFLLRSHVILSVRSKFLRND